MSRPQSMNKNLLNNIERSSSRLSIHSKNMQSVKYKETKQIIPVLMYHHFRTNKLNITGVSMTVDKFRKDMEAIKASGYTTMFFSEYENCLNGTAVLPDKPIIITIDDGYYSNYQYAYPILKELGLKATIYVVGSWLRNTEMDSATYRTVDEQDNQEESGTIFRAKFSWKEAKEMQQSGFIDIQFHTWNLHAGSYTATTSIGVDYLRQIKNGQYSGTNDPSETQQAYEGRILNDFIAFQNKAKTEFGPGYKVLSFAYPNGLNRKPGTTNILEAESVFMSQGIKFATLANISDQNIWNTSTLNWANSDKTPYMRISRITPHESNAGFNFVNTMEELLKRKIPSTDYITIQRLLRVGHVQSDIERPSEPMNLSSSNITKNGFTVNWNASTDNIGVTGYSIYLDGDFVTSVTTRPYTFTNLTPSKTYQVTVFAFDAVGNRSNFSTPLSVTTPAT